MTDKEYSLNDVVQMKKPHPCGENRWRIIRLGMDIRIKCEGCGHSVMIPRRRFESKMKTVLENMKKKHKYVSRETYKISLKTYNNPVLNASNRKTIMEIMRNRGFNSLVFLF